MKSNWNGSQLIHWNSLRLEHKTTGANPIDFSYQSILSRNGTSFQPTIIMQICGNHMKYHATLLFVLGEKNMPPNEQQDD